MRRRILLGNKMTGYIDKAVVYKKIEELEEIAKRRYIDAPWGGLAKTIYQEQFSEIRCLKHLIADEPSADVAPVRHGKWRRDKYCSCCNWFEEDADTGFILMSLYKYCPNCGAEMDLED